jgi:hypothetical protein
MREVLVICGFLVQRSVKTGLKVGGRGCYGGNSRRETREVGTRLVGASTSRRPACVVFTQ